MAASRRSSIDDVFFEELKEWSEIKLRIVEKYMRAYMKKRGSSHPVIYYIDGFAGPGLYGKPGDERRGGSPLRRERLGGEIA